MKIYKSWFITTVILILLFIFCILFNISASNTTDLIKSSNINTGVQNFTLAYDNAKKITIAGAYQNKVIAFDNNGAILWEFKTKGPAREIKVDEKNRKLFIGSEDRNVYILNIDNGKTENIIKVGRRIYSIDVNGDASLIAVSGGISAIKHDLLLYDSKGSEIFAKPIGATCKKVAFNSDYSKIILGSDKAEITLFDLKGNQLSSVKLNYEISDIKVDRSVSKIAVLTKNTTCYVLDENLNILQKNTFYGEGMSISFSEGMKWIGIGNKEGDFYIIDNTGKVVYSKRLDNSVTGILFANGRVLVTGLGNFIYEFDESKLDSTLLNNMVNKSLNIIILIIPVLVIVALVMSFGFLRLKVKNIYSKLIRHRTAYLLLLPTFTLLIVFCIYPVIIAFIRAFTDWSINHSSIREIKFIGFENFKTMVTETYFLVGLKNLILLIVTAFIKVLTVPLLIAELVFLMRNDRQKYWFRFLFVLPMVVPGIVGALLWQNIYDPNIGLINTVLRDIGLENLQRVWLGDSNTAIWAIIFMGFPFINAFAFLVYYGGLIDIPFSLFEAAKVDGSNAWWNFTKIHIPLITSQMKMLIILTFIGTIQDFGSILVLTGGGPGISTYVPGLELYYNATRFGKYGYACALGVVMFLVIFAGTLLNMKMKAVSEYND